MQGDEVGRPQQLVEADRRAARPLDLVAGDDRVGDEDRAPEGPQPGGDLAADPPEADDPDGQLLQGPHRLQRRARLPAPAPDAVAVGDDLPGQVQDQGERVVGDLVDAVIGDVADGDAPGAGRVKVDVVDADPVPGDDPGPVIAPITSASTGANWVITASASATSSARPSLGLRGGPDDPAPERLQDGPFDVEGLEGVIRDGDLHRLRPLDRGASVSVPPRVSGIP